MVVDPRNIVPNVGKIIVQPDSLEEKTQGGLYIPASAEREGTLRLGTSLNSANEKIVNGTPISLRIAEGEKVLFDSLGATKLKHEGKEYFLIRVEDVIGTVA